MAISILNRQQGAVPMGQNGRRIEWGVAAFSGTDASGTIAVNLSGVETVLLTAADTPASDEVLAWDDNIGTSGVYNSQSAGVVTIVRTGASPTSGLEFSYLIIGY